MRVARPGAAAVVLVVLAAGVSAPALAQTGPDRESAGWRALWSNQYQTAAAEFTAALAQRRDLHGARRGLILARLALGSDLAVQEALREYAKGAPHSDYDFFLPDWIDRNTSMEGRTHYQALLGLSRNLARSPAYAPVDRRRMRDLQLRHAIRLGEMGDVESLCRDLNRIGRWALVGPFDNTSGCGRDRPYLASFNYNRTQAIKGKFGQEILWFIPQHFSPAGYVVPAAHFHQDEFVTSYARTAVRVKNAGTYLLSVGYAGDVDLFLNGQLLHRAASATAGAEALHWLVDLPAGWSVIAFKVSGEEGAGAFSCALSKPDGSAVGDLEVVPGGAGGNSSSDPNPRRVRSDLLEAVAARAAADSTGAEAAFWNLLRSVDEDAPATVSLLCETIERRFPDCGLLRLAVARAYQSIGARSLGERALTTAAELAPELAQAAIFLARQNLDKKRGEAARGSARQVLSKAGDCLGAQNVILESLEQDQLWEEMRRAAASARERFRDEPSPLVHLIAYFDHMGQKTRVRELRQNLFLTMLPQSRQFAQATEGWVREDYGKAKNALAKLAKQMPESARVWQAYIYALIALGEYEEAEKTLGDCLVSFPQDVGLLVLKADFLTAHGQNQEAWIAWVKANYPHAANKILANSQTDVGSQKQQAVQMLRIALDSEPGSFQIRERISNLLEQRSYRTFLQDPDIKQIRARRVDPARFPGDDAVVLLAKKQRFMFERRATLLDYVLAVQVLTSAGVSRWQDVPLLQGPRHAPLVLAKSTLKADATDVEARIYGDRVIFGDLQVGDIVFLHVQLTEYVSGHLAGEFWDQHEFAFSEEPCLESVYGLIIPAADSCAIRTWNGEGRSKTKQPVSTELTEGYRRWTWFYRDLPAAAREPLAANARQFLPWIDISSVGSWSRIAEWYADLADGQAGVELEITHKARELTAGCITEPQKIAAVFHYVADQVTYESIPFLQSAHVPRRAAEVLRDGYGDCKDKACLMIALLKAVDVQGFRFALVTPDVAPFPPSLPAPLFNHAIVCRDNGSDEREWYDPTFRNGEPTSVSRSLAGVPALVARAGTDRLAVIPAAPVTAYPYGVDSRIALAADGNASITRREFFRQVDHIAWLRQRFEGYDENRIAQDLTASLAMDFPGAQIESAAVDGLAPGKGELTLEYSFHVPEIGQLEQDLLSLKIPWRSQLADRYGVIVAQGQRNTPIDLRRMGLCEQEEIEIELPAGRRTTRLPEKVVLEWNACRYETSYTPGKQGIRCHRRLEIEGQLVSVAEYPAFKEWLDAVRRDMRKAVTVRLG